MQNPCTTLAATSETKLVAAAHQKQVAINPRVVIRYIGLLPNLTASELHIKLPKAMATIRPP
jgi:hypothetical protein